MAVREIEGLILTRQWRDEREGLEFVFWAATSAGPARLRFTGQQAVCFIERRPELDFVLPAGARREQLSLTALDTGLPVDGLYFQRQRDLAFVREQLKGRGQRLLESDLKPSDRFLMERFVTTAFKIRGEAVAGDGYVEFVNPKLKRSEFRPPLRQVSLDIETDGLDGPLFSIAASSSDVERVFMVGSETAGAGAARIVYGRDEIAVLRAFFDWLQSYDPDLLIGWNVVNFDLDYLEARCRQLGLPFDMGRGQESCTVLQPQSAAGVRVARIPGRVVLDGIELLRAAFWRFESFELETVAKSMLGKGKRINAPTDRVAEIRRLFEQDKPALAAYNLADCRLVREIFEHAQLVNFALRRAELTGLAIDRLGGSVAAFDHLYLPRLHRAGKVAPDVGDRPRNAGSPGGYVLDSRPGLYENVIVLDFKSLYPSIIRTFLIDPYGLSEPGENPVAGFDGAAFGRQGAILPGLIAELWSVREEAKRANDAPLSQAVKILMNSFYGVLGANGCRFVDSRLASSITRRGHAIIRASRDWIEEQGHEVIYGDTDSLFALLGPGLSAAASNRIGAGLARQLNAWWRDRIAAEFGLTSYLEIEFETVYRRFLMPTVRGEQTGSKKRYAGLTLASARAGPKVIFKGLESVRTDWTPLAREFQRELYTRVFTGEPFADFVRATLADLYEGRLDEQLIYRKRLRRPVADYLSNVPPHVQAARKLKNPGRWIRYIVTARGPEPVSESGGLPRPDYEHYRSRQLAPAADGILQFLDTSFDELTSAQLSIF